MCFSIPISPKNVWRKKFRKLKMSPQLFFSAWKRKLKKRKKKNAGRIFWVISIFQPAAKKLHALNLWKVLLKNLWEVSGLEILQLCLLKMCRLLVNVDWSCFLHKKEILYMDSFFLLRKKSFQQKRFWKCRMNSGIVACHVCILVVRCHHIEKYFDIFKIRICQFMNREILQTAAECDFPNLITKPKVC